MAQSLRSQAEMPTFGTVNWSVKPITDLQSKVESFRESLGLEKSTVDARGILRRILKGNFVWTVRRHQHWARGMQSSKLYCLNVNRNGWCKYRDNNIDFLENEYVICVTNKMKPVRERGNCKQDVELFYHVDCFTTIFSNLEDTSGQERRSFAPFLKLTPFLDLDNDYASQHAKAVESCVSTSIRMWCQQILYHAHFESPSGIYGPPSSARDEFLTDDRCLYASLEEAWKFTTIHFRLEPLAHLNLTQLLNTFHTQAEHSRVKLPGFVRQPKDGDPPKRRRRTKAKDTESSVTPQAEQAEKPDTTPDCAATAESQGSSTNVIDTERYTVFRRRSDSTEDENEPKRLWMTFKKQKPFIVRIIPPTPPPISPPSRQVDDTSLSSQNDPADPSVTIADNNSLSPTVPGEATTTRPATVGDGGNSRSKMGEKDGFHDTFAAYSAEISNLLADDDDPTDPTGLGKLPLVDNSQPFDAESFSSFLKFCEASKTAVVHPQSPTSQSTSEPLPKRRRLDSAVPGPQDRPDGDSPLPPPQPNDQRRQSHPETLAAVDKMVTEMETALPEKLYAWTYNGITRPSRSTARQGQVDIEQTARHSQFEARRLLAQAEELESLLQGQNSGSAAASDGTIGGVGGTMGQGVLEMAKNLRLAAEEHLDTTEYCWNQIDEGLKEQTEWEAQHGTGEGE